MPRALLSHPHEFGGWAVFTARREHVGQETCHPLLGWEQESWTSLPPQAPHPAPCSPSQGFHRPRMLDTRMRDRPPQRFA